MIIGATIWRIRLVFLLTLTLEASNENIFTWTDKLIAMKKKIFMEETRKRRKQNNRLII